MYLYAICLRLSFNNLLELHAGICFNSSLCRILAKHLGEDQMFAVACRSFVTATALENYEQNGEVDCGQALHAAAAVCGNSINSRFLVMCLEDLRYSFVMIVIHIFW